MKYVKNKSTNPHCKDFICSNCNLRIKNWVTVEDDNITNVDYTFRYCPSCGLEIKETENKEVDYTISPYQNFIDLDCPYCNKSIYVHISDIEVDVQNIISDDGEDWDYKFRYRRCYCPECKKLINLNKEVTNNGL